MIGSSGKVSSVILSINNANTLAIHDVTVTKVNYATEPKFTLSKLDTPLSTLPFMTSDDKLGKRSQE